MKEFLDLDPLLTELLDTMSNGQWHVKSKIRSLHRKATKLEQFPVLLDTLVEQGHFLYGKHASYESYRMTRPALEQWRTLRGQTARERDFTAPRIFGGILEDDLWAQIPIQTHDIIHFRDNENAYYYALEVIKGQGKIVRDYTGLIQIYTLNGQPISEKLKHLSKHYPQTSITSVRLTEQSKRRDINLIPNEFLHEFFKYYGIVAHTYLRSHYNVIIKHLPDRDELQQQLYLWIIDAIQRYDEKRYIPFAAFLHTCLAKWVHNLSRKAYGRTIADSELKLARAKAKLEQEKFREPTPAELAKELDTTPEHLAQKIGNINSVTSINHSIRLGEAQFENVTQNIMVDSPETTYTNTMENTMLSQALTQSCKNHPTGPNTTAWLDIYNITWLNKSSRKKISHTDILDSMKKILISEG